MENFEQTSLVFAASKANSEIHNLNPVTYYPLALRTCAASLKRKLPMAEIRVTQLLEVALIMGDY